MSIQALPKDVIAQIKSSTIIRNLNEVIFELIQNSLDAEATKVDICVDYARGGCIVEDDGFGILPSEFGENGGLGKLHRETSTLTLNANSYVVDTSKLSNSTHTYGGEGTFLASLSSMSLLSITSHHHSHRSHNSLSMHKSKIIARQIPAPPHQHLSYFSHGTRVTVRDLFGSMPVRVKQRAILAEKHGGNTKEWDLLKHDVLPILLSWPLGVSITLRDVGTGQKMIVRTPNTVPETSELVSTSEVSRICSILVQASLITASEKSSWVSVRASAESCKITGAFSLDPAPNKSIQFITFGIQPLLLFDRQSILHDEVNRLFRNSAFGNQEAVQLNAIEQSRRVRDARSTGDDFTMKELKGVKKGVDRWPMFYIKIQQENGSLNSSKIDPDDMLDETGNRLGNLIEVLHTLVLEFLTKNHFRPKIQQGHGLPSSKAQPSADQKLLKPSFQQPQSADQRSILKKDGRCRRQLSNSDLLGAHVKLPSFHRSLSDSTSPYVAWSHVKSGSSAPKIPLGGNFKEMTTISSPLARSATAPLPESHRSPSALRFSTPSISRYRKSPKARAPLITPSGMIIRKPFGDETRSSSKAKPIVLKISSPFSSAADIDNGVIEWINPISKVISLVNTRTGVTIPVSKSGGNERSVATSTTTLASRKRLKTTIKPKDENFSPWINSILKSWDNPIFRPAEISIPQITLEADRATQQLLHGHRHCCSQLDIEKAFKEIAAGANVQITKHALRKAKIISQVDKKFILVKLKCVDGIGPAADILVIIDQHAADERIRIESLLSELCTTSNCAISSESSIFTVGLEKPLGFEISINEAQLLETHKRRFTDWGIIYDLPHQDSPIIGKAIRRLLVRALPAGIAERCKLEPRLLLELIRTEVHHINSPSTSNACHAVKECSKFNWLTKIHTCPQGIVNMLNSRACRSAIMFNDELNRQQCEVLVRRLADCAFPFQCAHGRPSLVPLVDLERLMNGAIMGIGQDINAERQRGFGRDFREWKIKKKACGV